MRRGGKKNNSDVFSQEKMSCVNRRSTSARYQLKETFPFKWGATELARLFEEMCLAQTRAAASPVFLTAETSLTPDGWSNTSHLSLNPRGGSSLYSLSLQINLQTTLLGHPSTQCLPRARSPDWMHCICKGKRICWFLQHLHSNYKAVSAVDIMPPTMFQVPL